MQRVKSSQNVCPLHLETVAALCELLLVPLLSSRDEPLLAATMSQPVELVTVSSSPELVRQEAVNQTTADAPLPSEIITHFLVICGLT